MFLGLFERLFPNFVSITGSQELDVLCYILVVSIGLSILFNRNASSGGLDIVAKVMNKYLHIELGRAMSLSGMCVALSAALVYDKKTVVLSLLGTYFNGIILDHFIFDHNKKAPRLYHHGEGRSAPPVHHSGSAQRRDDLRGHRRV